VVDYFGRYTARVVERLGDLVAKWITINEPMVYAYMRYFNGKFPAPAEIGFAGARKAIMNLLRCHAVAFHAIKERYPGAPVSVANSMQIFEAPAEGSALDRWWAKRVGAVFNHGWLQAMVSGRPSWLIGRGRINHLAGSFDFVGVNYYTRFYLRFPPGSQFIEDDWGPGAVVSDGNYGEVYPYGLYRIVRQVVPYKKPIYITENGLPDREDRLRPAFILDHLRQIWHALTFCYPVMGYYHWSLVDNFEWHRGWTQRFGLIAVDPNTQVRVWRPSGRLYQEICRSYSISSDMAARFAPQMLDVMFPG
jgi:beta-glucosidase